MKLSKLIKDTPPFKLANARGKRVETSTRDKARYITKAEDLEKTALALGYTIEVKEKNK